MILLLNPQSAIHNRRIPLSILTVAAGLEGKFDYELVDENFDDNVEATLRELIKTKNVRYLGMTVMPGPQLVRSIELSKKMKKEFPKLTIIWGGTFPAIHTDTVLSAEYVDLVVLGQGDVILPEIIEACEQGERLDKIQGIAFKDNGEIVHTAHRAWESPERIPPLPFHKLDVLRYLQRTYLGNRTSAYHSSVGCPFKCGFCSVVALFGGQWLPQSPERVANEVILQRKKFGVDSIEFFDDNFFTSEQRVAEFAERIEPYNISWWGEGRSDTLYRYSDATLNKVRNAGCRMIFTGAETSSAEKLRLMNKGGTQSAETILEFARRIKQFNIIPEFSFIFGSPSEDIESDIDSDIQFIRKIKQVNPQSEIIFYIYAPVLLPGSALYEESKKYGFAYPASLEDWVKPQWLHFDLRKNPMTPWLQTRHIAQIRNFERVLNAYFPTVSDIKMTDTKRKFLRLISGWRYDHQFYSAPLEVRFLLSKVFKYRQPELEGAQQYSPQDVRDGMLMNSHAFQRSE